MKRQKSAASRWCEAGFTLMEMLVSLVVLGLLLAGLAQAIHFGLGTYAREAAILARTGRTAAIDRALRRLIEQARQTAGTAHRLSLITSLPDAAAGAGHLIDAALYVDARHQLVLAWTPQRAGIPLRAAPKPRIEILRRGVARITLAYWWPKSAFGAPVWQASSPAGGLPRLIRLQIMPRQKGRQKRRQNGNEDNPDDGSAWPMLITAPALAR
jgi:general secretion pathway protein J